MKKDSCIIFNSIFLVQIASVINGLISDNAIVFIVDEEKEVRNPILRRKKLKKNLYFPQNPMNSWIRQFLLFTCQKEIIQTPVSKKKLPPNI